MKISKKGWMVPLSWLHAYFLFAGIYPIIAVFIGCDEENTVRFTMLSALLFLPIIFSWCLFRFTHALWQYAILSLLFVGVMGRLGYLASGKLHICEGVKALPNGLNAGIVAGIAMFVTALFSVLVFVIRGFVRIRAGRIKKEFSEMPGGNIPKLDQEVFDIPALLDMPNPRQWILFAVIYFIGIFLKKPLVWRFAFLLLFPEIFLCLIFQYTERHRDFITTHQKIADLPVQAMQKIGRITLGIAVLLLLALTIPSVIYGRDPLAEAVERFELKKVEGTFEMPEQTYTPGGGQQMDMSELMEDGEYKPMPKWLQNLLDFAAYLMVGAVAAALLRVIYHACKNAGQSFAVNSEDEILFLDKEDRDVKTRLTGTKGREGARSPNMRIRRQYRKTIRKAGKNRPRGVETPFELETAAGIREKDGAELLHVYYEKARYSEEGCTKEEAEEVKKLGKLL